MPISTDVERPRARTFADFKPMSDEEFERSCKEFPWLGNSVLASIRRNRAKLDALRFNGKSIDEMIRAL